jgi:hypothetical protein
MTSAEKSRRAKAPSRSADVLEVNAEPDADRAALHAKVALRPSVKAAIAVQAFAKPTLGALDLTALSEELSAQFGAVMEGNLQRGEAMLIAQAHTLEALFYELTRRAGLNMGGHLQAAETYMRLALKAQSQCRSTLEALAAIKNPPASVAFVRQANIAHGAQQVNNTLPAEAARARESEIAPNRLLETSDGKRLDFGAATQAVGENSHVEAVGKVDWT